MLFKNIGNINSVLKSHTGSISNILKDIGELSEAARVLKQINQIPDSGKISLLKKSFQGIDDDAAKAALGIKDVGESASESVESVSNLGLAMKGFGSSLVSFLKSPAGIISIIGVSLAAVAGIYEYFNENLEEAREKAANSLSDYNSTQSEIESINSELETTGQRIDELQAKGHLTIAEQGELAKLQAQNAELERTLELKQNLASYEGKQAAEDSVNAISKKSENINPRIDGSGSVYYDKGDRLDAVNEKIEQIHETEKRIQEIESELENSDLSKSERSWWESSLESQENILKGYEDYVTKTVSDIQEDMAGLDTYISNGGNLADIAGAEDYYNKYLATIQKFNEYSDPSTAAAKALNGILSKKQFADVEESLKQAAQVGKQEIESLINATPGLSAALDQAGISADQLYEHFQALANPDALNLDNVKSQLKELYDQTEDTSQTFDDFIKDKSDEEISILYRYIQEGDIDTSQWTETDWIYNWENAIKEATDGAAEDFATFQTRAVSAIAGIDNINAALANSVSGKGLNIEIDKESGEIVGDIENIKAAYQSLDGYDPALLFERTANGVHLNRDALRELQAQQEALQKSEFLEKEIQLQEDLNDAIARQAAAKNAGNTSQSDIIQAEINSLQSQLEITRELAAAYDGATSAYQKWINAQSNGEEGDMYDTITSTAIERGKELYEKGLVGTEEFRAIADLFSNLDLSTASVDEVTSAYEAAIPVIGRYFTEGQEGAVRFADKMVELGKATKDAAGNYSFDLVDSEEIADLLNIDVEAVESIFKKLKDYGFEINFADDNLDEQKAKLEEYTSKAKEAQEALKSLGDEKISSAVDFDIDDLDTVDELSAKIEELDQAKADPDISDESASQLQTVIDACQSKLDQLNNSTASPGVTLDGVQAAYTSAGSLISRINEIQNINTNTSLNIDINGDEKVQSLAQELASLPAEVKTSIGIESDADPDAIIAQITKNPQSIKIPVEYYNTNNPSDSSSGNTKTVTVNEVQGTTVPIEDTSKSVTVNYTKGTQEDPDPKDTNVNYKKGTQEDPQDQTALVNYVRGTQAKPLSPQTATVNYKLGTVAKPPSATVKVNYDTSGKPSAYNGTAHANGTIPHIKSAAFSDGHIGAKRSETALTGELGPELIVRDGKWFTVGDFGPEFTKIKQGDIIFNHLQTAALLKNGYVNSRGKMVGGDSFAEGTAYAKVSGGGHFNPGGSGSNASSGSSSSKKPSSNSSSSKKPSSNTSKQVKETTEAAEEFSETLDWIDILIDRIERGIEKLKNAATNVFDTFTNRTKALNDQISKTTYEIEIQQKAYDRYIQQANSVGLSEDWAKKIRDGEIDITEITDEDLNEKIQEYQKWYEKALDCADAIDDLKQSVQELYQQKFDDIGTKFDGILGELESRKDMLDAYIEQTETKGHLVSGDYYTEMITTEKNMLEQLQKEKEALTSSLQEAVVSGQIEVNSEAWYEMKSAINDVNQQIVESNTNIIEFGNSIRQLQWDVFDMIQDRISDINDESDFLMDLLDANDLFNEKGQITDSGKATFGLLGLKYNTSMSQADQYKQEIGNIDAQLESDPYNQDLINRRQELLELQREAISAAEDEKDAIKDLVQDGIDAQLDSLRDLIDAYTDMLDTQKDAYEYQKKVSEQQKDIVSLEKQLAAYAGDNSEEGNLKRQELENSLEEARTNLEETQYDQQISETKKLLDELYNEYETILNMRMDNIDQLVSDVIDNINSESSTIRDTIVAEADSVGYDLTNAMNNIWGDGGSIGTILTNYSNNFTNTMTSLQNVISEIKNYVASMVADANNEAQDNITNVDDSLAVPDIPEQPSTPEPQPEPTPEPPASNPGDFFIYKKSYYPKNKLNKDIAIVDRLAYHDFDWSFSARKMYYEKMGLGGVYTGSAQQNHDMIAWMKNNGFKSGTDNVPRDGLYWTNEGAPETIVRKSDGAILTPLNTGDKVYNNAAHEVLWDLANHPIEFIRGIANPTIPTIPNMGVGGKSDVDITFNLPGVENYEEFARKMQNDPKFEKMIQEMTIGRALGKGNLQKQRIKF